MRSLVSICAVAVGLFAGLPCSVSLAEEKQSPSPPPFAVRAVELAAARCSGFEGKTLSGLILEIENAEPGLELVLDAPSIKIKTNDGAVHSPVLMFYVDIVRGEVVPSSMGGTALRGLEVFIGETSHKAYGSMATMAVNLEEGGGMKYTFKEPSVFQIAFVFPVAEADIVRLDFLTQSVDLARTDLDLAGSWEGTASWPELTANVSFSVDKTARFLSGTVVVFECKEGEPRTKARLTADKRVRIARDGAFQVTFEKAGGTLSGKFVSGKQVGGDFKGTTPITAGLHGGAAARSTS